ncbi:methyltransferase domain-containing protein [Mucilaginibacter conchicola]|uniref:Methyltransferase domain-containing protein n=1 Tax=Mucilaginibacter conchicola TaxID=2303333 RepID=A0A372NVA1_9SPHI|nr:caspase family protein [Mucilaginibacter conchicola]RFZ92881.1 methyltransferase domain-containing protein [Mucilaginibacter conchicola]
MRRALLFGVDNYVGKTNKLSSCLKDVKDLAMALENRSDDHPFSVEILPEGTLRYEFSKKLEKFFTSPEPREVALFYFSGHASKTDNPTMQVKTLKDDSDGVNFGDLLKYASRSTARNTIIILDCCFAGDFGDIGNSNTLIKPGLSVLASSAADQASKCYADGNSHFTGLLLEALAGRAADERGFVDIVSIFKYISNRTENSDQLPIFKSNVSKFLPLKKVDPYMALNHASERIHNKVIDITKKDCVIKLVYQKGDYLRLLEEAINEAENEILFTSSEIADIDDELYGEQQKLINQASKKFKLKNPNRRHLGIVPSDSTSIFGACRLRTEVPDVSLRFKNESKKSDYNFFIADKKKIIIRLKNNIQEINYSLSIANPSIAQLMANHFFQLWSESSTMYNRWGTYKLARSASQEISDFIFKLTNRSADEFWQKIMRIDHNYAVLSNSDNKLMRSSEIPAAVYDNQSQILPQMLEVIKEDAVENLSLHSIQSVIAGIKNASVNYGSDGISFVFQYFLANYFKVRHSIVSLNLKHTIRKSERILDLGGGGGASTAAIIDLLLSEKIPEKMPSLTILDKSKDQIDLAKRILVSFSGINFINEDAFDYLRQDKTQYDLIVSSNFLCEIKEKDKITNRHLQYEMLDLVGKRLSKNGYLLLVEQAESKVYEKLLNHEMFQCVNYKYTDERFQMPHHVIAALKQKSGISDKNLLEFIKTSYTLRYGLYRLRTNRPV